MPVGKPNTDQEHGFSPGDFTKQKEQKADVEGHILLETICFGQVCNF